jgi:hypothetical protein
MRSILPTPGAAACLTVNLMAGILLAGTAALAPPALAQSTAAPTTPAPTHQAATTHQAAAHPAAPGMTAMVEQRIKDLHARLHITTAEESQWDQFAQLMRDNAKNTDALYQARADKLATMTAPDNMQSYAAIAQQHSEDMQKLLPAFQTLYNSFSDQQKHQADVVFRSYAEQSQEKRTADHK